MLRAIFILAVAIVSVKSEKLEHDGKILRTRGDLVLGGIFPMHQHSRDTLNPNFPCGAVKEEKGVQRLEAMLYAIDLINNDPKILPNVTLAVLIIDSCSSDTFALEQSMEFVRTYLNQDLSEYECGNGKPPVFVPHKPVIGVIGASFSVVSIMVANILRLFKIPQISYASTSTELSDKTRFEYFSRVVPPDNFQAQAMAETVIALNWLYVSTVAVEGDYGEKGIASFISIAGKLGICIGVSEKVTRNAKLEDFDRIIEKLSHKPSARAIVMFVDEDNVRKLLQASIRANRTGYFYWIGSDSWGAKAHPVRDQEYAALYSITVLPHRSNLQDFDRYYRSLRPKLEEHSCPTGQNIVENDSGKEWLVNCRNVWFNEFWEQHNKCSFTSNATKQCTGLETVNGYEQEGLVPFVVDAVYAMAYAIDNYMKDKCQGISYANCDLSGVELLKYIRNVSFTGQEGSKIRFNSDGDAFGSYNLYQYQQNANGKYDYVQIGTWKEGLQLNMESIYFDGGVPRLVCSEECPIGHVRNHQDQCCWSCVKCREDAYVKNDTCESCEPGWAPTRNRDDCVKLTPEVIEWTDPWAIVPLTFSSIGICSTFFTAGIYIKYNHTPVIKASGRELCYFLLTGVLFCYSMTFVILARPTIYFCMFLRIGLGLCLAMCYGAIFVKTNRISRIFNLGVKTVKRPSYISPVSQLLLVLVIVSVQVLLSIIWLCVQTPDIKEIYPYPLTSVLTCEVSTLAMVGSLIYNMMLIVLCTVFAFKTRKIPENFNEAKYIGFTMYSTCIVWLAFLPIYFGSERDYKVQISSLCMCTNVSASVILGCLFSPKVYLVLFQPDKNVRPAHIYGNVHDIHSQGPSAGLRQRSNPQISHNQPSSRPISLEIPFTIHERSARIPTVSHSVEAGLRQRSNPQISHIQPSPRPISLEIPLTFHQRSARIPTVSHTVELNVTLPQTNEENSDNDMELSVLEPCDTNESMF